MLFAGALVLAIGLASFSSTQAAPPDSIDIGATQHELTIFGGAIGDELGKVLASGDVNGDGIDDVVVSAPSADRASPTRRLNVGKLYVIYGSASLGGTIDLSVVTADVTILGSDTGDRLGESVAIGNFNGDGVADIVVGAPRADGPGNARANAGEAYVIFGSGSLPSTIDIASSQQNATIFGAEAGDQLGLGLAAGDINGFGADDIVVSAPKADGPANARDDAGETYVVFRSGPLPSTIDIAASQQDATILGAEAGDQIGVALAAGDINGVGADDIIVSAPTADGPANARTNAGESYVIFGSGSLASTIDIATSGQDVTILGAESGDQLGLTATSGDVSDDGIADIILAATLADGPSNSRPLGGESYTILGSGSLPSIIDLGASQQDLVVFGGENGDLLGSGMAVGDFSGDGIRDLILGAGGADGPSNSRSAAGEAYVTLGSVTLPSSLDIGAAEHHVAVLGAEAGDQVGRGLAAGDVNGDGTSDLLIGAIGGDGPANDRPLAGEAYVVIGGDSDGDGLLNTLDGCPDQAEDFDGIQDEDGCPETDADGDGVLDVSDNCDLEPNVGQADFEGDGIGDVCDDSDFDLFFDLVELFIGTDPLDSCAATATANDEIGETWPPDFNDDQKVSISDVLALKSAFGASMGDPNYNQRQDLTANGAIGISDVLTLKPHFGDTCVVANLGVTISDSPDPVTAGNEASYTVIVDNGGGTDAQNVILTYILPSETTFVSASPSQGSCGESGGVVTCDLGTVAASTAVTVIVTVQTGSSARGALLSSASVLFPATDLNPANNSDTEITQLTAAADLGVSMTDDPDPVLAGTDLTYLVTVTNVGPSDARNVVLTDTLPAQVTIISAAPSQGSCNQSSGVVTCSFGSIPTAASATLTVTAQTDSGISAIVTNNASVASSTADPSAANNAVSESTEINQTTIAGGSWSFPVGSTGNVVDIELSNLPSTALGDADITVAFDSAVLSITTCSTGDLSGACNPNAPGGPARAAGFAVPAITTEPVVIATLTFDCVGAGGTSALTITLNELMDGTAGDPQPIEAVVENGTVVCRP